MPLALSIAIFQQMTFLSYLSETAFFTRSASQEMHALMIGVSLFSAFLSLPAFIWNIIMVREVNDKKDVIGVLVSVATFAFGIGFLVFAYVTRLHAMGGKLF